MSNPLSRLATRVADGAPASYRVSLGMLGIASRTVEEKMTLQVLG